VLSALETSLSVTIQANMLVVRHATQWSGTGALCCVRDYERPA